MTPVSTTPVSIAGVSPPVVASQLTAIDGVWQTAPVAAKTYVWYSCNASSAAASATVPADCSQVQSGVSKLFIPTSAERGKHILVVEKALSVVNKPNAGEAFSVSATVGPIQMAPLFTSDPGTLGVLHVGEIITADLPEVQEFPVFATTYEWFKCTGAVNTVSTMIPNGCTAIGRSASESLTLSSAEAGTYVGFIASNTNALGTVSKASTASVMVTSTPVNTAAPILSGDPLVATGNSVVVGAGGWNATPAVTIADYSYAWFSCTLPKSVAPTSVPSDCAQVVGATVSSLTPTDEMAGKYLIARVTASVKSNKPGAGVTSVYTTSIGKVRNKPKFGATNPSIGGVAHLDEILIATLAPTTGFEPAESSYVWWQCSDAVTAGSTDVSSSCSVISGSQDASLRVRSEQVGKRIVVVQTANNAQGSVSRSSASTLVVSATPTIASDPSIAGENVYSNTSTVAVATGAWSGSPAQSTGTFAYTWYSCTTLTTASDSLDSSCSLASPTGVTANFSSIRLSSDWDGKYLVARETITTLTNKANSGVARRYSAGFGPINVSATNTVAPTISSNTAATGTRLRANLGTWTSGTKPISYSYLWYACATSVTASQVSPPTPNCSVISGFDSVDLVVPASAVSKHILLSVSATNAGGKNSKTSITTNLVTAATISAARLGWLQ
jgi:hypothetical protein